LTVARAQSPRGKTNNCVGKTGLVKATASVTYSTLPQDQKDDEKKGGGNQ